jgi:hypothetical protein
MTSLGSGTGTPDRVGRISAGLAGSSSESDSSSHLPLDFGPLARTLLGIDVRVWRDLYKPNMHKSQALNTRGWRENIVIDSSSGKAVST